MSNYQLKSSILTNEEFFNCVKYSRKINLLYSNYSICLNANDLNNADYYWTLLNNFCQKIGYKNYENWYKLYCFYKDKFDDEIFNVFLNEAIKIQDASFNRYKRLRRRISKMVLESPCCFLTLTFDDNKCSFENTSSETRRKYIRRYLKSLGCDYVANIDFGEENAREHYHAVVNLEKLSQKQIKEYFNKYGAIKVKKISCSKNDIRRLAHYINKLTNHAIKETCRGNRIIYSRKFKCL